MTDKAEKFINDVSSDAFMKAELEAKLSGAAPAEQFAVAAAFAQEKGYNVTEEDFIPNGSDMDIDELCSVTGGSGCGCFLGGYGKGGKLICSCIIAGEGTYDGGVTSQGGCECVGAGAGASNKHKKS